MFSGSILIPTLNLWEKFEFLSADAFQSLLFQLLKCFYSTFVVTHHFTSPLDFWTKSNIRNTCITTDELIARAHFDSYFLTAPPPNSSYIWSFSHFVFSLLRLDVSRCACFLLRGPNNEFSVAIIHIKHNRNPAAAVASELAKLVKRNCALGNPAFIEFYILLTVLLFAMTTKKQDNNKRTPHEEKECAIMWCNVMQRNEWNNTSAKSTRRPQWDEL